MQIGLDSFKFRYGIGLAKGPSDLMGLQYRVTTCTLTGLAISIAESSPHRILSPGRLWSCLNHEP